MKAGKGKTKQRKGMGETENNQQDGRFKFNYIIIYTLVYTIYYIKC